MSCSPFDLRDYFFGELPENARRQMDVHLKSCGQCREDWQRLRVTEAALLTLREEEIPQRIGFVSDKVFEPSAVRRWWQAFWGSAARLGFASAAMLSAAILVWTLARPAPVARGSTAAPQIDQAKLEAEFSARLNQAIQKAVAESETRQLRKTAELLAAAERRNELERQAVMLAVEENFEVMKKHWNRMILASNDSGASK